MRSSRRSAGWSWYAGATRGSTSGIRTADFELSIGDYVLTGGELPAMVIIDAVARLQSGVLGDDESAADESFAEGLLEYPQYTRPALFRGMDVPEVLRAATMRVSPARRRESIRRTAHSDRTSWQARAHRDGARPSHSRSSMKPSTDRGQTTTTDETAAVLRR